MRIGPLISFKNAMLRHPFDPFGKMALIIGLLLFSIGCAIAAIAHFAAGEEVSPLIFLFAIASQGVVWLLMGVIFGGIARAQNAKLNDLRQRGRRYDGEIVRLSPVMGVHMGSTPTVVAECLYVNEEQQRCKVKSAMFLWRDYRHDTLQAAVYADWNDPRRYAVEITQRAETQPAVDIDYT